MNRKNSNNNETTSKKGSMKKKLLTAVMTLATAVIILTGCSKESKITGDAELAAKINEAFAASARSAIIQTAGYTDEDARYYSQVVDIDVNNVANLYITMLVGKSSLDKTTPEEIKLLVGSYNVSNVPEDYKHLKAELTKIAGKKDLEKDQIASVLNAFKKITENPEIKFEDKTNVKTEHEYSILASKVLYTNFPELELTDSLEILSMSFDNLNKISPADVSTSDKTATQYNNIGVTVSGRAISKLTGEIEYYTCQIKNDSAENKGMSLTLPGITLKTSDFQNKLKNESSNSVIINNIPLVVTKEKTDETVTNVSNFGSKIQSSFEVKYDKPITNNVASTQTSPEEQAKHVLNKTKNLTKTSVETAPDNSEILDKLVKTDEQGYTELTALGQKIYAAFKQDIAEQVNTAEKQKAEVTLTEPPSKPIRK